jgi:LmbE family N-acetylglucosaminyl deacetylase
MTIAFSVSDRVLFFAPHPDDETLGAAGLLQRAARSGARIQLVVATNGDDNVWAQRCVEKRWYIAESDRLRWGELRKREVRAAVGAMSLGRQAHLRFLNLRDQKITSLMRTVPARLSAILREEIDRFKPTLIIAPSIYDAHPDHSALSVAIALALERSDRPSTRCYYYIIHRPGQMPESPVRSLRLTDEELHRKRNAIDCHRSQLYLFPQRFTQFAQPTEIYYESDSAETMAARYGFELKRTSLNLSLELDSAELLKRAREILLVFSPYDADPIAWRIKLSSGCKPLVLEDAGTGAFLGQIDGGKKPSHLQMSLPAMLSPESQAVYLKIVARTLFFDRFGWFRMTLPVLRQPAPKCLRHESQAESQRSSMGEVRSDSEMARAPSDEPMQYDGGGPAMEPERSLENGSRSTRWQHWIFRLAIVGFIVSRLVLAWQQPIDSDEPQHAHVAWAWAHGFVQYRDVFDNHTPLFHLLSAPLAALIGDRADILARLRCGIIGLNLITLFLVWRICSSLFSAQAARWTVIALAFFPPFFLYGAEFRTDALWTTLWVAWIAVVISRIDLGKKCFWGGLLMAACFSASLKSVLLLLAAAVAFAAALALRPRFAPASRKIGAGAIVNGSVLALAGFFVFAGSVLGFFIALGAGPAMYQCVVQHNLVGNDVDLTDRLVSSVVDPRIWFFAPAVYFVAFQLAKFDSAERRFRIAFLLLLTSSYPILLRGIWPVLTRQDFLPYYPLLCVSLSSLIFWSGRRLRQPVWSSPLAPLASFAVLLLVEGSWSMGLLLRKYSSDPIEAERIGQVLQLTKPGETVLDPKGEVVLRPRPIYDVLESFTMKEYRDDLMTDRIPEQLIARRTMVAVRSDRYPEHTRWFLQDNYLSSGRLLIAGVEAHENAGGAFQFQLSLGGSYVFLSDGHLLSGKLNGVQISGTAEMQPGFFEFVPDTGDWPVTIQWERAYQMGIIGACNENLPWHGTRPHSL